MSSMVLSGDTSGTVTVTVPAVAGTNTATIPAATGTVMVSGNMPAFSAYQSVGQTISTATTTKVTFTTSEFDTTNGMYASSRFTPTIAGYYQVNSAIQIATTSTSMQLYIYKNGSNFKAGPAPSSSSGCGVNSLIYLNGLTDYIEIYLYLGVGQSLSNTNFYTYFNAALIRN